MDNYQKLGFALIVLGLAGAATNMVTTTPEERKTVLGMDYETKRKFFLLTSIVGGVIVGIQSINKIK